MRNWVLLPITLVMVLVGMFRNNLMQLFEGKPKLASLAASRQQYVCGKWRIVKKKRNTINAPMMEWMVLTCMQKYIDACFRFAYELSHDSTRLGRCS